MQQSRPIFAKIDELVKAQEKKKAEKIEASVELPELKKVIKNIKSKIDEIKQREKVFVDDKSSFDNKITLLKKVMDDKYIEIRLLRTEKNDLKEKFYSSMIEFELQQLLLRDIDWLQQQKVKVLERDERQA